MAACSGSGTVVMANGDNCTISQTFTNATTATTVERVEITNGTASVTVNTGIVNGGTGQYANGVVAYGQQNGNQGAISTLTNNGTIANTGTANGSPVSIQQNTAITINNNGTITQGSSGGAATVFIGGVENANSGLLTNPTGDATINNGDATHVGTINSTSSDVAAGGVSMTRAAGNLNVNNVNGQIQGGWAGVEASTTGNVDITNGSSQHAGTIRATLVGDGHTEDREGGVGVYVENASGVVVDNKNGTISGRYAGVSAISAGSVTVINGDGTHQAVIEATGNPDGAAIFVGHNKNGEPTVGQLEIVNQANGIIRNTNADGAAIEVHAALGGTNPHVIRNAGTISAASGYAIVLDSDQPNSRANHNGVQVSNTGTIAGAVVMQGGDNLDNQGQITANRPAPAGSVDTTTTTTSGGIIVSGGSPYTGGLTPPPGLGLVSGAIAGDFEVVDASPTGSLTPNPGLGLVSSSPSADALVVSAYLTDIPAAVFASGSDTTTINNGTTVTGATIANTSASGIGIAVGGFGGSTVTGGLTLNQGSATTSGTISSSASGGAAVWVANTSGDVTINNVQGTISGETAVDVTTSGHIAITNGNGTQAGRIIGTGADSALLLGTNNLGENLSPTFTVTNNAGSEIKATQAGQTAIEVAHAVGAASSIANHGTIAAGAGGTAIDTRGNTSGSNGVAITNDGTIRGAVLMGVADTLTMAGGSIVGGVSGGAANVTGNSAISASGTQVEEVNTGIRFDGDHTLTLTKIKLLNRPGNTTTSVDNQGTIAIKGGALYGEIGEQTKALKAVNITGGVVDLDNNTYHVNQTTVQSGATLQICGTGCSGDTPADPSQHIHGNLAVDGGTLDLTGAPITRISAGTAGSTGAFTTTSGSMIKVAITGDGTTSGAGSSNLSQIITDGAVTLADGTRVVPVLSYSAVTNGARYLWIDGTGDATVGNVIASNTALLKWKVMRGDDASLGQDASDVYMVAEKNSVTTVAGSSNSLKVLGTLEQAAAGNAQLQALLDQIAANPGMAAKAAEQLKPNTSVQSATQGSMNATTGTVNAVGARTSDMRVAQAAGGQTGIAAGESLKGFGVWAQAIGFTGSQGMRRGQDGFDADTLGMAFGGDIRVADPLRVGVAFSYSKTNVDSTGDSSGSGMDVNSYQGTLYASYTGAPWYVDGMLIYGVHKYDATRALTALSQVATADYEGRQYTAQVAGGYPLAFGNTVVTPNASLAYSRLNQDAYTESGAGGANLTVDSQQTDSVRSGLGVKASHTYKSGTMRLVPEVRATWFHEYAAKEMETTAAFAAGGSTFTTTGAAPARDSLALGVGVNLIDSDQLTVSANYDAELKEHYLGHTGTLQVRWDF